MKIECAEEPKHHVRFLASWVCAFSKRHDNKCTQTSWIHMANTRPRTMVACLARTMLSYILHTTPHTITSGNIQMFAYVIYTKSDAAMNSTPKSIICSVTEQRAFAQNVKRTREMCGRRMPMLRSVRSIEQITFSSSLSIQNQILS